MKVFPIVLLSISICLAISLPANGQFIDSLQYFASSAQDAGRGVLSLLAGTSNFAQATVNTGLNLASATVQGARDLTSGVISGAGGLAYNVGARTRRHLGEGVEGVGRATTFLGRFTRDLGRVIQGASIQVVDPNPTN